MYKQQRGNESCEAIQNLLSSSVIRDFSFLSDIGLFPLMPHVSSVFYVTLLQCFHYLMYACMFRTDFNSDLQTKIKKKQQLLYINICLLHRHSLLFSGCILYSFVVRHSNCEGEKTCMVLHNIFL